jgi:hypothetical protein
MARAGLIAQSREEPDQVGQRIWDSEEPRGNKQLGEVALASGWIV